MKKDSNEAMNSVKSNAVFGNADKFQTVVINIKKNTEDRCNLNFNNMKLSLASSVIFLGIDTDNNFLVEN